MCLIVIIILTGSSWSLYLAVWLCHPVCLRRLHPLIDMQCGTRRPQGDSISGTSIKLVVGHSAYVSTVVH